MQNKRDKRAIETVLLYLKNNEPSCNSCDHCIYGWKSDMYVSDCLKQQAKIKLQHKQWENKVKYWEEQLLNAE